MNCGGRNFANLEEFLMARATRSMTLFQCALNSTPSSSCSLHDIVHDEPPERNS